MACIVKAWERYTQGDTGAARAALEHLQTAPELQPVFRYNPRVRFECLNLLALLHKHAATGKAEPAYRQGEAAAALRALNGALEAAYEADSIDAAQHVAANIGWCMWLFWQQRLIDPEREQAINAVQLQAMRWLGLSEWICDRFGYGSGSAWNLIFMLRIARGNCSPQRSRSLASFRAQQRWRCPKWCWPCAPCTPRYRQPRASAAGPRRRPWRWRSRRPAIPPSHPCSRPIYCWRPPGSCCTNKAPARRPPTRSLVCRRNCPPCAAASAAFQQRIAELAD